MRTIVVLNYEPDVPEVIERMANLGYQHSGNLGIEERESFSGPVDPPHHDIFLRPSGDLKKQLAK